MRHGRPGGGPRPISAERSNWTRPTAAFSAATCGPRKKGHDRGHRGLYGGFGRSTRDNASLTNRGNSFFHLVELKLEPWQNYNAALEIRARRRPDAAQSGPICRPAAARPRQGDPGRHQHRRHPLDPTNPRVHACPRSTRSVATTSRPWPTSTPPSSSTPPSLALTWGGPTCSPTAATTRPPWQPTATHCVRMTHPWSPGLAAAALHPEGRRRRGRPGPTSMRCCNGNPGHAGALNNRGTIRRRRGEHEPALFDFTAALEADSQFTAAWFNRASANADAGRLEDAVSDYTACLRLNPEDLAALTNRARVLHRLGRYEDALADNRAVLRLAPTDFQGGNNLAWLLATVRREDLRIAAQAVALSHDHRRGDRRSGRQFARHTGRRPGRRGSPGGGDHAAAAGPGAGCRGGQGRLPGSAGAVRGGAALSRGLPAGFVIWTSRGNKLVELGIR